MKIERGAWVWHRTQGRITVLSDSDGTIDFVKGHVTIYGTEKSNVFITEREMTR